jgi:hypothetical protein
MAIVHRGRPRAKGSVRALGGLAQPPQVQTLALCPCHKANSAKRYTNLQRLSFPANQNWFMD